MQRLPRICLLSLSAAMSLLVSSCGVWNGFLGNVNEGINVKDLSGKILIPKTLAANSSALGMVYIGVFASVAPTVAGTSGYLAPVSAPPPGGGLEGPGNTYPFGGTSIGDFDTLDARFICKQVNDRTVIDDPSSPNLEVDFEVLQFPFYPGSAVWAFSDQFPFHTCNSAQGSGDTTQLQIFVTPTTVVDNGGGNYTITTLPANMSQFAGLFFDAINTRYLDKDNRWYKVTAISGPNEAQTTLKVTDYYGYHSAPSMSGQFLPALFNPTIQVSYGTEFEDVLNFPTTFIVAGDLVPSVVTTIQSADTNVTLTLDKVVP